MDTSAIGYYQEVYTSFLCRRNGMSDGTNGTNDGVARDPEYFTVREFFVNLLRLSEKSGYRIMKADATFPVLTVGGTKRIPSKRGRAWLSKHTQGRSA
jgi:hypothetical protein